MEEQYLLPSYYRRFPKEKLPKRIVLSLKIDGNMGIGYFDDENANEWRFLKRSQNEYAMKFNMSGFDKECVYFGEVASDEAAAQAAQITKLYKGEMDEKDMDRSLIKIKNDLRHITGRANRKDGDASGMKFLIFDYKDTNPARQNMTSEERKTKLEKDYKGKTDKSVEVLEVLEIIDVEEFEKKGIDVYEYIKEKTRKVVEWGGEGLVLNNADAVYYHSRNEDDRTADVQKSKKFYTMDMEVVRVNPGGSIDKQKSLDLAKDLQCAITTEDGERISVNVWNGIVSAYENEFPEMAKKIQEAQTLTRYLKELYVRKPEEIIGEILEVEFFEKTQNKNTKGTNEWSAQQAKIKRFRRDKTKVSEF